MKLRQIFAARASETKDAPDLLLGLECREARELADQINQHTGEKVAPYRDYWGKWGFWKKSDLLPWRADARSAQWAFLLEIWASNGAIPEGLDPALSVIAPWAESGAEYVLSTLPKDPGDPMSQFVLQRVSYLACVFAVAISLWNFEIANQVLQTSVKFVDGLRHDRNAQATAGLGQRMEGGPATEWLLLTPLFDAFAFSVECTICGIDLQPFFERKSQ